MSVQNKPKILVIAGPTAAGKSALAMEVAREISAEIVNSDSLQVYRRFDIGTAKPAKAERSEIPHHLIDILNPDEEFNAGAYRTLAREKVDELHRREIPIILTGGTYLYVRALLSGIVGDVPADAEIRRNIRETASQNGWDFLYRRLALIDPEAAARIHSNDSVRIERALEVYELTGEKMSELQARHNFGENDYEVMKIGIWNDRDRRREIIDERVDGMIALGFVEEVKNLREAGFSSRLKPMQSIGYKQINQFLDGEITFERAVELIKRDTKRFAKRQMTWLRAEADIRWRRVDGDFPRIMDEARAFFSC